MRSERMDVSTGAVLFRGDGSCVSVRLANISYGGCQITTLADFEVGERVRLHQRGQGLVHAEIRWVRQRCAGLMFIPECTS